MYHHTHFPNLAAVQQTLKVRPHKLPIQTDLKQRHQLDEKAFIDGLRTDSANKGSSRQGPREGAALADGTIRVSTSRVLQASRVQSSLLWPQISAAEANGAWWSSFFILAGCRVSYSPDVSPSLCLWLFLLTNYTSKLSCLLALHQFLFIFPHSSS